MTLFVETMSYLAERAALLGSWDQLIEQLDDEVARGRVKSKFYLAFARSLREAIGTVEKAESLN